MGLSVHLEWIFRKEPTSGPSRIKKQMYECAIAASSLFNQGGPSLAVDLGPGFTRLASGSWRLVLLSSC
jgi:hypothetical protein